MNDGFGRKLFHEYFYKRLSELDDEERQVINAIRTKTGLVILCDKLRALELEKQVVTSIYEDLRLFF